MLNEKLIHYLNIKMIVLRMKKIKQINEKHQIYLYLFVAFNITGGNSNSKQTVYFLNIKK